jgi:hypothetical protein
VVRVGPPGGRSDEAVARSSAPGRRCRTDRSAAALRAVCGAPDVLLPGRVPAPHSWAGRSLAVFACTHCADDAPPDSVRCSRGGRSRAPTSPKSSSARAASRNFRFVVFETGALRGCAPSTRRRPRSASSRFGRRRPTLPQTRGRLADVAAGRRGPRRRMPARADDLPPAGPADTRFDIEPVGAAADDGGARRTCPCRPAFPTTSCSSGTPCTSSARRPTRSRRCTCSRPDRLKARRGARAAAIARTAYAPPAGVCGRAEGAARGRVTRWRRDRRRRAAPGASVRAPVRHSEARSSPREQGGGTAGTPERHVRGPVGPTSEGF